LTLLAFYITFVKLGLLMFGGGYVLIPLLTYEVVKTGAWMNEQQLLSILTLGQMTPGPFAVNTALLLGLSVNGPLFGVVAVAGLVTPALGFSCFINRYIRPYEGNPWLMASLQGIGIAVVAVVLVVALQLAGNMFTGPGAFVTGAVSFTLFYIFRLNPAISMGVAAVLGVFFIK